MPATKSEPSYAAFRGTIPGRPGKTVSEGIDSGKVSMAEINSNLTTFIRTVVILAVTALLITLATGLGDGAPAGDPGHLITGLVARR
jgi:hypothetical protein